MKAISSKQTSRRPSGTSSRKAAGMSTLARAHRRPAQLSSCLWSFPSRNATNSKQFQDCAEPSFDQAIVHFQGCQCVNHRQTFPRSSSVGIDDDSHDLNFFKVDTSSRSTAAVMVAISLAAVTLDSDPLPLVRRRAMTLAMTTETHHSTQCFGCNSEAGHRDRFAQVGQKSSPAQVIKMT